MTTRRVLWLIGAFTAVRVLAAVLLPPIADEAYYWVWARRLDWSYLDQPPAIAYLIAMTTLGGRAHSILLIRLGPLLLGVATTYALYLLGRDLFGVRAGILAALLFQAVPAMAAGGVVAAPEGPLYLAWVATLRLVWQAMQGRPRRWFGAGLVMGLGLLSKFYMVFLGVGVAAFVALRARLWFRRREPYLGVLLAAAVFAPVIYWNAVHGWAMIAFVLSERAPGVPRGPLGAAILLAAQFGELLLLFPVFCWGLWVAWKRRLDDRFAYLLWTGVPALAFPLAAAVSNGAPLAHWMIPGFLGLTVVLGGFWNRAIAWLTALSVPFLALGLLFLLLPRFPAWAAPPSQVTQWLWGWREAAQRADRETRAMGGVRVLVADRYQMAAHLAYETRDSVPVTLLPRPPHGSVWPPLSEFEGANSVLLMDTRWLRDPKRWRTPHWRECARRVVEVQPLTLTFHGAVRTFRVFRLYGLVSCGEN